MEPVHSVWDLVDDLNQRVKKLELEGKPPFASRADSEIPERGKIRVSGEFRLMPLSGSTRLCHSGEILDCRIERRIPGDTDTYRDFAYFRNGSDAALVISVLVSSQPTSGPPTPDLAASPDSNKKDPDSLGSSVPPGSESALRENDLGRSTLAYKLQQIRLAVFSPEYLAEHQQFTDADQALLIDEILAMATKGRHPTSGPPTPDLAAQPDSNKKTSDSLGSSVPPGSESEVRWGNVVSSVIPQPLADAYEHHGLPTGHYWVLYEGEWITGNWDGEDWNLANGVTTSSRHVLRGPRLSDPPAGGPPTPDLAAQPDSIIKTARAAERAACIADIKAAFWGDERITDRYDIADFILARIEKREQRDRQDKENREKYGEI